MDRAEKINLFTIKDYEELNDDKHRYELIDGVIYAMAGASIEHGILTNTIGSLLENKFDTKPCLVVTESLKVKIKNNVFLPDIGVICDPIKENNGYFENPVIVIEVLSKSTEYKDRTLKLSSYLKIPFLFCYLLVEQDKYRIERYSMVDNNMEYNVYFENQEISIMDDVTLKVNDVYKNLKKYRGLRYDKI